jgi:hypothetical protein
MACSTCGEVLQGRIQGLVAFGEPLEVVEVQHLAVTSESRLLGSGCCTPSSSPNMPAPASLSLPRSQNPLARLRVWPPAEELRKWAR